MRRIIRRVWWVLRDAVKRLSQDDTSLLAGAISFFAFLSLLPTMLVAIIVVGWFLGRDRALDEVITAAEGMLGPEGASALEVLLANASFGEGSGWVALGSLLTALYGGSRAFRQLQVALDRTYEVRPRSGMGWRERVRRLLKKRAISVLIVLSVAVAVLLSVVAKTVLAVVAGVTTSVVGDIPLLWSLAELVVSTGILALFLGVVYTMLPDVIVEKRDVAAGALVAAGLLSLGAKLLSLYITSVAARSLTGAAATFIVTLLWLYYTAFALLFGAELTAAVACLRGHPIRPEPHAERIGVIRPRVDEDRITQRWIRAGDEPGHTPDAPGSLARTPM